MAVVFCKLSFLSIKIMVLAQFLIFANSNGDDATPPRATINHFYSGKRVRMRIIQVKLSYLNSATPLFPDIPFRIDMDNFRSETFGSNAPVPAGQQEGANPIYTQIVCNATGFGYFLGQPSATTTDSFIYHSPYEITGTLLGNSLTAFLQVGTKAPGDYLSIAPQFGPVNYVLLVVDIEPI